MAGMNWSRRESGIQPMGQPTGLCAQERWQSKIVWRLQGDAEPSAECGTVPTSKG